MRENSFNIQPIGYIQTPYGQKFSVPRQPGIVNGTVSTIKFFKPYSDPQAFVGLEGFSHIHVLFIFDQNKRPYEFKAQIRPPRLGGNKKVGVFASRSPNRPSQIGLSVLKIISIDNINGQISLRVQGADLVDNTPIIDIKPYIPFVDRVDDATALWADSKPEVKEVIIEPKLEQLLKGYDIPTIKEILSQDPRPAYKGDFDNKIYHTKLYDLNIYFKVLDKKVIITNVSKKGFTNEI